MWFTCFRTIGLSAIQGLLVADALTHPEKPVPASTSASVAASANIDGPLTRYELHYGIARHKPAAPAELPRLHE